MEALRTWAVRVRVAVKPLSFHSEPSNMLTSFCVVMPWLRAWRISQHEPGESVEGCPRFHGALSMPFYGRQLGAQAAVWNMASLPGVHSDAIQRQGVLMALTQM